MENTKRLILASASPRRREILSRFGLPFDIIPADADESVPDGMDVRDVVEMLAARKCDAVCALQGDMDYIVISSDTVVSCDGAILGKPADETEARAMLRMLSGREHEVYSGYAISDGVKKIVGAEATSVRFRELSDADIDAYIATKEPFDKAGGYGIQSLGCVFVSGIDGDYYNVMGFPIFKIARVLESEFGISLLEKNIRSL